MSPKILLLACVASTLFMTGVIWFVHVVHYPLFDRVEPSAFRRYHADHTRTTTFVVVLPMLVELVTSAWLVVRRPDGVEPWLAWLGLALAIVSWGVTFLFSVPSHEQLSSGFDAVAHRRLVDTNLFRLLSWTAHAGVVLLMTARAIR
jgi:hypothetical protein